jgi:beta-phosphoglucomutase-like phosphatase (HAD superfamily)
VSNGKPHPDPYLAGAKRCDVDPKNCTHKNVNPVLHYLTQLFTAGLVVEDAPSGLNAGRAAGSKTLAVCTSHTRAEVVASDANPDFIVKDLTR